MVNTTGWVALLQQYVTKIARIFDWIGRGFLVACILLVVCNIIGTLMGSPIPGTYEYIGVLTAVTISLSLAYCQVNKGHIRINILVDRLPMRVQAVLGIIGSIISAVLFGLVVYASYKSGMALLLEQRHIGNTPLLLAPIVFTVGLGCLLISLVLVVDALNFITKLVKK